MEKTASEFIMEKEAFIGALAGTGLRMASNFLKNKSVTGALGKVGIGRNQTVMMRKKLGNAMKWSQKEGNKNLLNSIGYSAGAGALSGMMFS